MFGIGIQELLIILVLALLVLGPTKLPGVARSLGKGLKELRKASDDLRGALMIDDEEPKRRYTPPPRGADAPMMGAESANAAPGIHGSLAAGGATVSAAAPDDDGSVPISRSDEDDGIVSRGEEGGDPHKRAPEREVPADPDATALLEDARGPAAAARADARGIAAARSSARSGETEPADAATSAAEKDASS